MRLFPLAVMMALVSALVYGQTVRAGEPDKTQQQLNADRAAEEAYKRSLGNIPDRGATDPWGNVRSDVTPKPVAKPPPGQRTKGVHSAN